MTLSSHNNSLEQACDLAIKPNALSIVVENAEPSEEMNSTQKKLLEEDEPSL